MAKYCASCDSTEDVRVVHNQDTPPWGEALCRHCRDFLARMDAEDLERKERKLLADWGTIGQKRTA